MIAMSRLGQPLIRVAMKLVKVLVRGVTVLDAVLGAECQ